MELVNHPEHYNMGTVEVIDVIEGLIKDINDPTVGFNLGQSLKYILRCPYKENMYRDLKKADWYLQRAIKILEDNYEFEIQDIVDDDYEDDFYAKGTHEEIHQPETGRLSVVHRRTGRVFLLRLHQICRADAPAGRQGYQAVQRCGSDAL